MKTVDDYGDDYGRRGGLRKGPSIEGSGARQSLESATPDTRHSLRDTRHSLPRHPTPDTRDTLSRDTL
jgi:hypothetical protein